MSEMRVVLHREIPAGEEFRQEWNSLVQAMEQPEVFYTWEWAQAVSRVYGELLRPLLFAAYRGEKLTGIAALAAGASGEICFLTASTSDYCDFVSAPADREEFIELVMRELRAIGAADLRLANLPADSASAPVLQAAKQTSGYSVFARPAYFCAQVALSSSEDRAQLSKTASSKLKRMTKAAGELRAATVEHGNTWEEFDGEFAEFAVSHVARFLFAGEVSNLVRRERRTFLTELARLLSAQGWLALSTLKIDGQSMAWNYGFRFAGKWFYYQPTFDVEARRLSAG
jgi:CelD/BcsL family acetyltransferase involved in cellulose biosynthesis